MATLNSCPKSGRSDRDLYAVVALFWLASLANVVITLVQRDVFGIEAYARFGSNASRLAAPGGMLGSATWHLSKEQR